MGRGSLGMGKSLSFVRPHERSLARVMNGVLVAIGLFTSAPAQARGGCYGDCSGNGAAILIVGPLVLIYFKYWNKRKGGPTFSKCLGYLVVGVALSLGIGFGTLSFGLPLWLTWTFMAVVVLGSFAVLIHPRRHTSERSPPNAA